jgi:hypothetical protein
MVVDDTINQALNRIADNQEEINDTLKRILSHYDGVVPVMTRNANRAELQGKAIDEEMENSFGEKVRNIFSPQEH